MTKWSVTQYGAAKPKQGILSCLTILLILTVGVSACDADDLFGGGKPNTVIISPPSGSSFHEGEDVPVQSVSTDSKGVLRVELVVDGIIVRTDAAPTVQQNQFTLVQTWKATQGTHTILVRAYNSRNVSGNPATISIQGISNAVPAPTSIIGAPLTNVPGEQPTSVPGAPPTSAPGGSPTRVPGGPPTSVPGAPPTSVPGGSPTRVPGGPPTNVPGGPPTSVPGAPPTRVPGSPATSVPGSPATSVPGAPPTSVPGSPPTSVPGAPPTKIPASL